MTSVDIDPELLREAKERLGVSTNREAIITALEMVARKYQQHRAIDELAKIPRDPNPQELWYPLPGIPHEV